MNSSYRVAIFVESKRRRNQPHPPPSSCSENRTGTKCRVLRTVKWTNTSRYSFHGLETLHFSLRSLFFSSLSANKRQGLLLVRQSRLSSTKTYHYIIIIISFKDGRGREGLEEIMEEIVELHARRKRNLPLEMFRFEIQMTNSWRLLEGQGKRGWSNESGAWSFNI